MATMEHLKIEKFRGFDLLEIEGLSKVNPPRKQRYTKLKF